MCAQWCLKRQLLIRAHIHTHASLQVDATGKEHDPILFSPLRNMGFESAYNMTHDDWGITYTGASQDRDWHLDYIFFKGMTVRNATILDSGDASDHIAVQAAFDL